MDDAADIETENQRRAKRIKVIDKWIEAVEAEEEAMRQKLVDINIVLLKPSVMNFSLARFIKEVV